MIDDSDDEITITQKNQTKPPVIHEYENGHQKPAGKRTLVKVEKSEFEMERSQERVNPPQMSREERYALRNKKNNGIDSASFRKPSQEKIMISVPLPSSDSALHSTGDTNLKKNAPAKQNGSVSNFQIKEQVGTKRVLRSRGVTPNYRESEDVDNVGIKRQRRS